MGMYVKSFEQMTKKDFEEAGGKAANLGDLTQGGFNVPPGFCVTSRALPYVIEQNNLQPAIGALLEGLDFEDFEAVEDQTAGIRALIEEAAIPADLEAEIRAAIARLCDSEEVLVAVRSSVAVRGSKISSFPGMMDTYHYIRGADEIIRHVRMCWASLWTSRAALNRQHKAIPHDLGLIAAVVQKMVDPEVAGIMFTANPITGSREEIVVESNWGLGESVVSGKSMNDFFLIEKADLALKSRKIARKTVMVCFDQEKGFGRKETVCRPELMEEPTLNDEQVGELIRLGLAVESWFGFPQDVEWAYEKGRLFVLQSRNIKNLGLSPAGVSDKRTVTR